MIQGSIKVVAFQNHDLVKVGYVLGLRVAPDHRRKGIGLSLVQRLEEWFISNDVDYVYMATDKANLASVSLFMDRFGYTKFRSPAILVNPVSHRHCTKISSNIEIAKLKVEQAGSLYRRFMGFYDLFPDDIDSVLKNKLSLGTWVAYFREDSISSWGDFGNNGEFPRNWAMLSVWNSGEMIKLRLGKATFSCLLYTQIWSLIDRILPCLKLKLPSLPDLLSPFGLYFMYGMCHEGPLSGKLVRGLCEFVHNMAAKSEVNIRIVATEVEQMKKKKQHIPHWKMLSCLEDLWCIKALKNEGANKFGDLTKTTPSRALFVDPREF